MVSQPVLTRRMAMAGAAAASLVGTAAFAQGAAQTAHGTVFDDADASGRRSDASRGIADVMVSNGRDVVLTDADGRWSLPVADGDAIFVVKPTGWATPLAPGTNLSMCSRLHQPDGTPA
jgi:hypothetical protein